MEEEISPANQPSHPESYTIWGMMSLPRCYSSLVPAITAVLLLAACVDITPPWAGLRDAGGGSDATADRAGGTSALRSDAGSGGSGGSIATDGTMTGGTATDGASQTATGGATGGSAGSAADAAATGGMAGTGGTGGFVAADAGAEADPASSLDVGIDVPFSADTNLPSELETGVSDGAETGESDGSGTGGTGDVRTDAAPTPMIISIDFVGGMSTGAAGASGTVVMDAGESAGVKRATHWNSAPGATGSLSSLVSASGSATAASASWSVPALGGDSIWSVAFTDAPGDVRMMNGYLDPRSVTLPATISVTGLPNAVDSGYDVYVYCCSFMDSPDTRNYQYKIGSTTYSVTQTGPSASTFPGYTLAAGGDAGAAGAGNYVVFRNVTGPSFTMTAQPRPSTYGTERAPVNGIQIVFPSGY